ncbi:MAG: haloacid dehalogenase type II [Planctomycetes bacterium]|nr:haloacid dehalogenase type II [Planctomycetota bacterium]
MNLRDFDALTFDCYGTLIDWERGIAARLVPWAARHGLKVSAEQLLQAFAAAEHRHETATPGRPYPQILETVLADIAAHFGVAAESDEARTFGRSVRDWPPFPDSPAALAYLKQHYKLVIISNVDRASFAHSQAKLGVEFDAVITAQDVGNYKPDLRNFEFAFARLAELGVPRDRILHVAQSLFHDHEPAKQLGLRTVWINRRAGQPGCGATAAPRTAVTPDLAFESLAALADAHRRAIGG